MRPFWTAVALMTALGCAPETELVGQGGAGSAPGTGPPPGAAGAVLVDPTPGASGVPVNLAALVIRFPGAVTLPDGALRACGEVPVSAAEPVDCDGAGACYRAALGAELPPSTSCQVELADGGLDGGGQPLAAGLIGLFDTAAAADETPPVLTAVTVALAGPCLSVQFSTDEPATGEIVLAAGDVETVASAGAGQTSFDAAIPLGGLPAASVASVTVRATDRAGNVAEASPVSFQTPPPLPPLAITEVLANAAGPEPAQEYVELRNLGADPVSLDGLAIDDSKGGDALPADTLPGGAYALVVTSTYDPQEGSDPPPRAGTLLVRVDSRIGSDGLSNGGEAVRLMLGDAVVSSYGGWVDVSASSWSGKSVHRLIDSACDRPDAWNRTPLPPTPGWGPP
jgi:hypothetical protein